MQAALETIEADLGEVEEQRQKVKSIRDSMSQNNSSCKEVMTTMAKGISCALVCGNASNFVKTE